MFCIAIQKSLPGLKCPLDKGHCYWQHRLTKDCKYTTDELAVAEFCSLVGLQVPSAEEQSQLLKKLQLELV